MSKKKQTLLLFLGSNRASTYFFVNYLLTAQENKKIDEKLVAAIRHETLTLAKNALLKTIQHIQQQTPNFLKDKPGSAVDVQMLERAGDGRMRIETIDALRRLWALSEVPTTFWRLSWTHPSDPSISLQSELAFILSNAKVIFTQSRQCMTTLALRFVHALFEQPSDKNTQLQMKQQLVVRQMPGAALPPVAHGRNVLFCYSLDMCAFQSGRSTLAEQLFLFRDNVVAASTKVARASIVLLFANLVQFCIDVERYRVSYAGVTGYTGPPHCSTSLYHYIEQNFVAVVPPAVSMHLVVPKANSRYDFTERTAPLLERLAARLATGPDDVSGSQRNVRRHVVVQAGGVEVDRHPGALPTLSLANKNLSVVHLLDLPSQWSDVSHLDLSHNRIEMFPLHQLMALPLHSLSLVGNRLPSLEQNISLLTSVRKLDLSINSLSLVPRSLQTLVHLRELRLSQNKLIALSTTVLQRVTQLETLDASRNRLSTIPIDIGRLARLRVLQLSSNQLTSLPAELGRCVGLRVLGVADNLLVKVPTCLAQLTTLESLDLERNRLACSLARSSIATLTQLSLLALAGNEDIVDVPASVLKKAKGDAKHLFRHLSSVHDAGDVGETRRARLVVLGNAGAGKTSLIRALLHGESALPGAASSSMASSSSASASTGLAGGTLSRTDGGAVAGASSGANAATSGGGDDALESQRSESDSPLSVAPWLATGDGRRVQFSVWDVPDTRNHRHLVGALVPPKALVLLVWDIRAPLDAALGPWLAVLRAIAPTSSVALVATHSDSPQCTTAHCDRTWAALRRRYLDRMRDGFVRACHTVSSTTLAGIETLRTELVPLAPATPMPEGETASTMSRLDDVLTEAQRQRKKYVMKAAEVTSLAHGILAQPNKLRAALQCVADSGSLTYVEPPPDADNVAANAVLIGDPQWIVDMCAPVLDAHTTAGPVAHAEALWPRERTSTRRALVTLLRAADACVPLPRAAGLWPGEQPPSQITGTIPPQRLVVMSRLSRDEPCLELLWPVVGQAATFNQAAQTEYRRVFTLEFVPPALLGRLLACAAVYVHVEHAWQTGALLSSSGQSRALVRVDSRKRTVSLAVRGTGDGPARLLDIITQTLRTLLHSWYAVAFSVQVVCHHCLQAFATVAQTLPDAVSIQNVDVIMESVLRGPPTRFPLATLEAAGADVTCWRAGQDELVPTETMIPDLSLASVDCQLLSVRDVKIGEVLGHGAYGDVYVGTLNNQRVAIKELRAAGEVEANEVFNAGGVLSGGNKMPDKNQRRGHALNNDDDVDEDDNDNDDDAYFSDRDNNGKTSKQFRAFRREVWIMSRLNHPNVVRMIGFTHDIKFWLVLEFVPHGDLYTLLNGEEMTREGQSSAAAKPRAAQPRTLTPLARVRIALDIARGMQCLHNGRPPLLHRDLKSPNIFLSSLDERNPAPMAKVADFGLSMHLYSSELRETLKTRAVENPTWLAPEVLSELPYGLPSDVYSFGIILWELLTQQHPFREFGFRFLFSQEQAVLEGCRPTMPPNCSMAYASLIARCWAQQPSDRPTFARVVNELKDIARNTDRFQDSQADVAAPSSGPGPMSPYLPVSGNAVKTLSIAPLTAGASTLNAAGSQTMELSSIVNSQSMRSPSTSMRLMMPDPIALALRASSPNASSGGDLRESFRAALFEDESARAGVSCLAVVPSGEQVLAGMVDGSLAVFSAYSAELVQRVTAHTEPVGAVLALPSDAHSSSIVLSVAPSGLIVWNLAADARRDDVVQQGLISVRPESGVDGDDLFDDLKEANDVVKRATGEGGAGSSGASDVVSAALHTDRFAAGDERARVRWLELRRNELRVLKERNGRPVAGIAPLIVLSLLDATFVDGSRDAQRDSSRYVGVVRTSRRALHLWSPADGGVAERDAWRQLLARTVDALVYPGVYRRLRRTASLAASPTFVPKCVAQVGGAIWVGCDGLRVAVLDTTNGAPLYQFRLAAPPIVQWSSARLLGDDAFEDVRSSRSTQSSGAAARRSPPRALNASMPPRCGRGTLALPINAITTHGDSALLAVGDQLLSIRISECNPQHLRQLASTASRSPPNSSTSTIAAI